jgi:hypothetical protein
MSSEPETFQVRVQWGPNDGVPLQFANQIIAQVDRGEAFLTFGQLQPPVLLGDREEQAEQARSIDTVTVQPVARLTMPIARVVEFVQALTTILELHERQQQQQELGAEETQS